MSDRLSSPSIGASRKRVRSVRNARFALGAMLASMTFALPAFAQQQPPQVITPLTVEPDRNGVNIGTGKLNVDVPTLGVPAAPRLRFDKVQNLAMYVVGNIQNNSAGEYQSSQWSVHYGGQSSETFKCKFDDVCKSNNGTGSDIQPVPKFGATYIQAGSGEMYAFTKDLQAAGTFGTPQSWSETYYGKSINYPDGETLLFAYDKGDLGAPFSRFRPTKVTSNTGYYITINYWADVINVSNIDQWETVKEAALYGPADAINPLQKLTYSADGTTVTDIGGRVYVLQTGFTAPYNKLSSPVELFSGSTQLPTEAGTTLTLTGVPNFPMIGTLARDGVQWNYAYTNPALPFGYATYVYDAVTATGPNGYSMTYTTQSAIPVGIFNRITARKDALNRTTTYTYDLNNRINHIGLPEGNSVDLLYGGNGQITTKTTHAKAGSGLADLVEHADYGTAGNGPGCSNLTNEILCWRPISYTDALGRVTNYSYVQTNGLLTQQLDPANAAGVRRQTDISYEQHSVPWVSPSTIWRKTLERVCGATTTCSGNAESHTETTYWNDTFLPLTVTVKDEATGTTETTTYSYDPAGRPLSIQGPQNGVSGAKYFRYDLYGRKIWEIGAADASNLRIAKRFTYRDSDDKVAKVETGTVSCPTNCNSDPLTLTLLEQSDTTYDSRRYPIREATSSEGVNYRVTDRSFLDRGLADCTTVRMNMAALPAPTATSACAVPAVTANPDRITRNVYDNAGQLLKIQKAYGVTTANGFAQTLQQDYVTYAYTLNGKQQYVTDANANKAQYTWDGHDRLSKWNFPSPTASGTVSTTDYEQYGYDAAGNRVSLKRRDGRTLTFTYDNLNRMLSKLIPDGCPPIQPAGTGCPAATATRDVFYGYDTLGRQLTAKFDSTSGADGITNAYDGFGNLTSSTISMAGFGKAVTALYDLDNNRTRVTHPDAQAFTYAYDARDRLTGVYEGIGTSTPLDTFAYNADDTLGTRTEAATGGGSSGYGYDPIGRLTSQTDAFVGGTGNVAWTFGTSPASQIINEARDNDAYAFTGISAANKAYAVNGLNQYTAVAGTAQTYDANGNLTGDGTNAYIYDGENRLVSATAAGATTTLAYDPLGRLWRVQKGANDTRFLYDGDALVGEYDAGGNLTNRYVHGSNLAADDPLLWYVGGGLATKRYLHADHLGSIIAATNASGASGINAYDEYGIPGATNVGRFQYTGQIWLSELGLYHYKARLYSPTLGRFLQTDPIGYEGGINIYAYVEDEPVDNGDYAGLDCCYGPQGYHSPPIGNPNSANFLRGSYSYFSHIATAWRVSFDASGLNGQAAKNRAELVTSLTNHGIDWVLHNRMQAYDIAKHWALNNKAYAAGRVGTQAAVGLAVGRFAGPETALTLQASATTGAAYAAFGGLMSQMEKGGFDTSSMSGRTLGTIVASVGIAGASVNFDAKSGNVTGTLRADQQTGTRIVQKMIICNVSGQGAPKC
jgi:RHS repeat-associated protein